MKNIQFVTALHGNETLPVLALASINQNQLIGNPRALSKKVRFTEKDLNSSFGSMGTSYEEKRAHKILKLISTKSTVVDLHTFSGQSDPFVIIVDMKMLSFAKTLGFKNIVYMKHNIKKGHALINHRDGVSIEMGNHNDPKAFKRTIELVKRLKINEQRIGQSQIYEVYDIINKSGTYLNFETYKGEFTPILAGENAYDFYGLKARLINA